MPSAGFRILLAGFSYHATCTVFWSFVLAAAVTLDMLAHHHHHHQWITVVFQVYQSKSILVPGAVHHLWAMVNILDDPSLLDLPY